MPKLTYFKPLLPDISVNITVFVSALFPNLIRFMLTQFYGATLSNEMYNTLLQVWEIGCSVLFYSGEHEFQVFNHMCKTVGLPSFFYVYFSLIPNKGAVKVSRNQFISFYPIFQTAIVPYKAMFEVEEFERQTRYYKLLKDLKQWCDSNGVDWQTYDFTENAPRSFMFTHLFDYSLSSNTYMTNNKESSRLNRAVDDPKNDINFLHTLRDTQRIIISNVNSIDVCNFSWYFCCAFMPIITVPEQLANFRALNAMYFESPMSQVDLSLLVELGHSKLFRNFGHNVITLPRDIVLTNGPQATSELVNGKTASKLAYLQTSLNWNQKTFNMLYVDYQFQILKLKYRNNYDQLSNQVKQLKIKSNVPHDYVPYGWNEVINTKSIGS